MISSETDCNPPAKKANKTPNKTTTNHRTTIKTNIENNKNKPQTNNQKTCTEHHNRQDGFLQACMCGEPACSHLPWISNHHMWALEKERNWGAERKEWLGRHLLFGDFVLGYVRPTLWHCLMRIKGTLEGESNSQHFSEHSQMNAETVRMIKLLIFVPTPCSTMLIGACRALIFLGLPCAVQCKQC